MSDPAKTHDARNLIADAYRIEGITGEDCRSVFLDWTLGLPAGSAPDAAAAALLAHYRPPPGHPMTALLQEAASAPPGDARRRGGAEGRRRDQPD